MICRASVRKRTKTIRKITNGYVVQLYDKERGQFVSQEFIASDEVDYEDEDGKSLGDDDRVLLEDSYLPYEMAQPNELPTCLGDEYDPTCGICVECRYEVECMRKHKEMHPECWNGDDWI